MPANVPPVRDEREGLLAYLAQQREALRIAAYGLTDEQARATPTVGTLSIGGLLKHVATTERGWMETVQDRHRDFDDAAVAEYEVNFRLGPDETLTDVLALFDRVAAETEALVADIADLGRAVPVPTAPWFPPDVEEWSVRWVLLHLIEETARHAGHADLVREALDGATAMPLMAASEGWPPSPWIQPWEAPAERA
jgi:uncharacterized damage-inducible protein DinB